MPSWQHAEALHLVKPDWLVVRCRCHAGWKSLCCIAGRPKLQTIWADQFTYFSLDVMLYPVFSTSPRQVHTPQRRQDAAVDCI